MAKDYAQRIPSDRDGKTMTASPPPFPALAVTAHGDRSTSSAIGLNQNTTVVEVTTVGMPAGIKWGSSIIGVSIAQATRDYDSMIAANSTRVFVVPRATAGIPNQSGIGSPSTVGMNRSEGLYTHMAIITGGIGSVFTAEF